MFWWPTTAAATKVKKANLEKEVKLRPLEFFAMERLLYFSFGRALNKHKVYDNICASQQNNNNYNDIDDDDSDDDNDYDAVLRAWRRRQHYNNMGTSLEPNKMESIRK